MEPGRKIKLCENDEQSDWSKDELILRQCESSADGLAGTRIRLHSLAKAIRASVRRDVVHTTKPVRCRAVVDMKLINRDSRIIGIFYINAKNLSSGLIHWKSDTLGKCF